MGLFLREWDVPRFSANLSMLYGEHDFLRRFAAAASDGFEAVEYLGPYAESVDDVVAALRGSNLQQVLFNLPAGDWEAGERGIACLPDRTAEFRDGVATAIRYALALGCPQVNCLAGIAPAGADRAQLDEVLVANLQYAAKALGNAGIKLLLEPINRRDIPGFFVSSLDHYAALAAAVGSDNFYLQYDFYHMQIVHGDLVRGYERFADRIAHVQIADNPGRHEPGTGEINYPFILETLDRLNYGGWVGCEYKPLGGTSEGLGWRNAMARASAPAEGTAN